LQEWCKFRVGGVMKTNQGLLNRRKSESQLFMKQTENSGTVMKMIPWTKPLLIEAQNKLFNLGLYSAKIDGIWGPRTSQALLDFAKSKNIQTGTNPKVELPEELLESLRKS